MLSPEEWAAEACRMRREGASLIEIANSLRAFGEKGGKKINAVSIFGNECGWSVKQKLELLSWTEGGVTDKELTEFVPWP
ncbi:hypothetical protein AB0C74_39870 [Spirillospora sp. NPDC048832]